MKANIEPKAWTVALKDPRASILMRRWSGLKTNVTHMEEALLALMSNPLTTQEQLSMAAKLYTNTLKLMYEAAVAIDDCLYKREKPESKLTHHMLSCAATKTGNEEFCNCKDWD